MSCLITSWVIEMTSILSKENSVKPNIKADGSGRLRGRRRGRGLKFGRARHARSRALIPFPFRTPRSLLGLAQFIN